VRRVPIVLVFALGWLAACSDSAPQDSSAETIVGGQASNALQDSTVLLAYNEPQSGRLSTCTGTMIGARLVLTARHCVSKTDAYSLCGADGSATAGAHIYADYPAASLRVFTGHTLPDSFTSGAHGRGQRVVTDGATTLCNHDVAVVVLEQPVARSAIAPVRLYGAPRLGDLP
jgi:Trypsin